MLVVHVHVRIRPGQVEEFLAATLVNARASLTEPGVLRFDVIQDEADPAHVVLVEVYREAGILAADVPSDHVARTLIATAQGFIVQLALFGDAAPGVLENGLRGLMSMDLQEIS